MKTVVFTKFAGAALLSAFMIVMAGCGGGGDNPGNGNNGGGGGNDDGGDGGGGDVLAEIDVGWYESDPNADAFQISSAGQLAGLAQIVNDGTDNFMDKTITLSRDIDLSAFGADSDFNGGKGWVPIGDLANRRSFGGTFDGGGKRVGGLYINNTSVNGLGLFGFVFGTVKNLNVAGEITGMSDIGGIVGSGRAENCRFTGAIAAYGNNVGGIVGIGSADRCGFNGSITGMASNVGGIAGRLNDGSVTGSYSVGAITGGSNIGGLVGQLSGTEWSSERGGVLGSYSASEVTASGRYAGGLVGLINIEGSAPDIVTVSNCAALNPSVTWQNEAGGRAIGYISYNAGGTTGATLANIAAYSGMSGGNFAGETGASTKNGENMERSAISAGGSIGGRFTNADGWATASGKLPGIGAAVDMPEHLR